MKKNFLILIFSFTSAVIHGQTCTANFGFSVDTNNVVTMIDSSSSTCVLYIRYNYGDPLSGNLNSMGFPNSGFKHFYKNAGTYTICQYVFTGTSCSTSCYDTICKQITLPDSGSNCQAVYTYTSNGTINGYSFTNSSFSEDSISTVFWNFNDGSGSPLYSPNHIFPTTMNYTVCLYIQTNSGCQSSTCDTLQVNTVGVNKDLQNVSFNIFPNPFAFQTTISFHKGAKNTTIKIRDILGKEIKSVAIPNGTKEFVFKKENLVNGIYFYNIISDSQNVASGKLVIQ